MSEINFEWPEFTNQGKDLYPLPVEGEIARIVTKEDSGRDMGGCVLPNVKGLLVIKVASGYETREFHFSACRRWDSSDHWVDYLSEIKEKDYSSPELPAFVWRKCQSSYHFDFEDATAEIEVVPKPSSEWLVAEMSAVGQKLTLGQAEEILQQREEICLAAVSGEPILGSLQGVWLERSQMDIRSIAFRWLARESGERYQLESFCDPRPPKWRTSINSYDELYLRGRLVVRVPKGVRDNWKKMGFSAPTK